MSNQEHQASGWGQIEEAGTLLGIKIMLFVYQAGGRPLFRFFLFFVVTYFYLVRSSARRASRDYIRRLRTQYVPGLSRSEWVNSLHQFYNFGDALIDKIAVWRGEIGIEDVDIEGAEIIDRLEQQGKGAMLLISHLGNFEICQCLSSRREKLRLTVIQDTNHAKNYNSILRKNDNSHVSFLQVKSIDIGAAVVLSEKISNGQFVAISGDRLASQKTRKAQFLGSRIDVAPGPFLLGTALGCEIVALNCVKQNGRYKIIFKLLKEAGSTDRAQRIKVVDVLISEYFKELERILRTVPLQWYNFFDFFHSRQQ